MLAPHEPWATGTTGALLADALDVPVHCVRSRPLGGGQQIGGRLPEGVADLLVFFSDPLSAHPHDPDVKALLRLAVLWNVPTACNRATADYLITSPLFLSADYVRAEARVEATDAGAGATGAAPALALPAVSGIVRVDTAGTNPGASADRAA